MASDTKPKADSIRHVHKALTRETWCGIKIRHGDGIMISRSGPYDTNCDECRTAFLTSLKEQIYGA